MAARPVFKLLSGVRGGEAGNPVRDLPVPLLQGLLVAARLPNSFCSINLDEPNRRIREDGALYSGSKVKP
jgi:hypothetical protein